MKIETPDNTQDFCIKNDEQIPVDIEIVERLCSYCESDITPIIEVASGTNSDPDTFYTLTQTKEGIIDGTRVTFCDTGKGPNGLIIRAEVPWRNGTINGNAKYYYPSGALMEVVPYINGEVQGIYKVYKEDGELGEEILYERGKFPGSFLL